MNPDRFRQIQELYHAASGGSAEERAALLAQVDPDLRQEVESLMARQSDDLLLDHSPFDASTQWMEPESSIAVGTRLGPYCVEGKLGEGGMGEVFRALDTRLGRAVAIKTTHAHFNARFEREARAISALNHPHVCTLYDIGPNYLVMELVEGDTLAALLESGPLPLQTALLYGSQIAAALGEAHAKGIVHRDLKPGNIMIGKSGVKVLDFGLARSSQDEAITGSRMIVGTPAYMAPEQREGKPADARADIYAFGRVLFEMLTGSGVGPQRKRIRPRKLEQIITRCLENEPGRRWQSTAELQRELAKVTPPRNGVKAGIAAAAILALSASTYLYLHRAPRLTARDTVMLAEFENKTGDPVFDHTLRQGLAVQLQQSPFVALVSDERINQQLRFMNRPLGTRLTPEVSREICARTGGAAVLEGSIERLGSQFVLWLRARNCRTGEVLAEEQAQTETKEAVLKDLGRIATQMRSRLGESMASVQEHSMPPEATTSSLEAFQAYTLAKIAMYSGGGPAAIPHLQRAIAIDPQFAIAHAELGFMSWNLGQTDLGAEEVRIAYGLRDKVSDRERYYILMLYDRQVTGNLQKELDTLEAWARAYPRDAYAPGILAGWVAYGTGNYEKGIQYSQDAMRLDPDIPFPYSGVGLHSLALDRYSQAEEALRKAAERKLEIPEFLVLRYDLAFLKGDQAGMDREVARAPAEHSEDWMSHNQALVLARLGRMREARNLWARAVALAKQAGRNETAAIYEGAEAVCEAHFSDWPAAKEHARAALQLARGRDVEYAAAYALTLAGDLPEAQRLTADLEKRFPEDTPVQFEYLPTLGALGALARQAPPDALERLQRAAPYDFAMPGTAFYARFGTLYPAYVRGQANLAAGRGAEAAAEFQKILNRRGLVLADPIGVLAHLQLGRAYGISGDRSKAKAAYEQFLALWKDADPEIPVLKLAKAEYAKF